VPLSVGWRIGAWLAMFLGAWAVFASVMMLTDAAHGPDAPFTGVPMSVRVAWWVRKSPAWLGPGLVAAFGLAAYVMFRMSRFHLAVAALTAYAVVCLSNAAFLPIATARLVAYGPLPTSSISSGIYTSGDLRNASIMGLQLLAFELAPIAIGLVCFAVEWRLRRGGMGSARPLALRGLRSRPPRHTGKHDLPRVRRRAGSQARVKRHLVDAASLGRPFNTVPMSRGSPSAP
jgi:hypothetical protein